VDRTITKLEARPTHGKIAPHAHSFQSSLFQMLDISLHFKTSDLTASSQTIRLDKLTGWTGAAVQTWGEKR